MLSKIYKLLSLKRKYHIYGKTYHISGEETFYTFINTYPNKENIRETVKDHICEQYSGNCKFEIISITRL